MSGYAPVWLDWKLGQVLRPEHFRALEGSISERSRLLVELDGLPRTGLVRLLWRDGLLRNTGELLVGSGDAEPRR